MNEELIKKVLDIIDKHFDSIPMEQTTEILSVRREIRNLSYANIPIQMSGTSEELISRRQAEKALCDIMPNLKSADGSHPADAEIFAAQKMCADCIETIRELPSATVHDFAKDAGWVQKKHEKWIKKTKIVELNGAVAYDPVWICPKCGTSYDGCFAFNFVKYCYCCGIDLRTEEGEQE